MRFAYWCTVPHSSSQNKILYVVEERSTFVLHCPKLKNKNKLFWRRFPNQEVLWFYLIYNGQLLIYFSFLWVVSKFGEHHTSNEGVRWNTHKDHTMAITILWGSLSNRPTWSQLHTEWYSHDGAIRKRVTEPEPCFSLHGQAPHQRVPTWSGNP
jgi:hypothetical protein